MPDASVREETFRRYYLIVYSQIYGGAERRMCVCRAPNLTSALRVADKYRPVAYRTSACQPITCDQIKQWYHKLNFNERLW